MQQILDLKEQLNTLKAETGKGTDVSVTLQLVRQLTSAPRYIRDPFAMLAALQKLADEARVSGNPSASRYEDIQSRPLSSSPDFGNIIMMIIRLLGSKEESDVAPRAIFIPMLGGISHSTSEPEVCLQGVLEEVPELVVSVSVVASVVT